MFYLCVKWEGQNINQPSFMKSVCVITKIEEGGVQERRRTTNDMSTSEGNEMTTTPSVVQPNLVCKNDDRGHGNLMIKLTISKQVWCDRGKGRGSGWLTKRIPKYICRDAKKIPEGPSVSS